MASATVVVKVEARDALLALASMSRSLWEAQWLDLTGVPWEKATGGPHLARLDITLGRSPWDTRVRVSGTALEVACRAVSISQDASTDGWVTLAIPLSEVTLNR